MMSRRFTLPPSLCFCALCAAWMGCASPGAGPASPVALPGDGPSESRRVEIERISPYQGDIDSLIPLLNSDDLAHRQAARQGFERRCLEAGAPGKEPERLSLCNAILPRLSPDTPQPARVWLIRMLERIGREECVDTLVGLLDDSDPEVRESARRALEKNPAAGEALRAAYTRARDPSSRVALLNALAARAEPESLALFKAAAEDGEPAVARAAVVALSGLSPESVEPELMRLVKSGKAPRADWAANALLRVEERRLLAKQYDRAAQVYLDLFHADAAAALRWAALRGYAAAAPSQAIALISERLRSEQSTREAAFLVRTLQGIPSDQATAALATALTKANPPTQALVLDALAARGARAHKPAVAALLESPIQDVRLAALEALVELGDAGDALTLATLAAGADSALASAARAGLARLRGSNVDAGMLAAVAAEESSAVRAALIQALAARRYREALPSILTTAGVADDAVRVAAFEFIGQLGSPRELPTILGLLARQTSEAPQKAAEDAAAAIALRIPDGDRRTDAIIEAFKDSRGAARLPLARLLGRVQCSAGLDCLRIALKMGDEPLREAAARALAQWSSAEALPDLAELSRAENDTLRVLALRAYVRLVRQRPSANPLESFLMLREVSSDALRVDERKLILAALADAPCEEALSAAREALATPELTDEAATAMVNIARGLGPVKPALALAALQEVDSARVNDLTRRKAQETRQLLTDFAAYVGQWQVSGPYWREKLGPRELFDTAFDPETGGGRWVELTARSAENPWIYDLTRVDREGNRCVYVRARIQSPSAQPARLVLGSDDAVKVWLNGELVHSNFVSRPVAAGDDKVDVNLKAGDNTVLMKVVQGSGGWGFCCGVLSPTGQQLENVAFSAK